ncbi:unnamed protein product [Blepharisma stoltei]|uniref:AAA+ ATPase domain-containing protein n=1 Tax=Blepharisma stoltei TaxID=1481888 RepID=A0AAU9JC61_9CILI|nr:unnamed protein product [Blepharisma stoltei]
MWVLYSYDVGSINTGTETFGFPVPEKFLQQSCIGYTDILDLLIEYQAYVDKETILSIYDQEICAYRKLKKDSIIDISNDEDIEIQIKNSEKSEIGHLLYRVADIEDDIWNLTVQKNVEEIIEPVAERNAEIIDICMLYAAPLILKDGAFKVKECDNWNLDFNAERRKILDAFERNQIYASIRFETATLQHLSEILECKPKVIHISCHGYYKKNRSNEFVLAFEDSECLGMVDEVDRSRLKKILEPFSQYFCIVIVSACFSQAIGNVFLEAGIKCVITIHDQCKILDDAAIEFSSSFYRNLLMGRTINDSFLEAKNSVKIGMHNTCCCAHNHKRNCLWKGSNNHRSHSPDESCGCERRLYDARHKIDCEWGKRFTIKFNNTRIPTEAEVREGSWVICCCSQEVPHHEAMKFKLLKADEESANLVLFSGRKETEIKELCGFELKFKPPLVKQKIIGRGDDIRKLLDLTKNSRIVFVYGKSGMGKSLLVKSASIYACERRLFKHGVIYIDLQGKCNSSAINTTIAQSLNISWEKSKEELARIIDSLHVLIILDNIGESLAHYNDKVKNKIRSLIERTQFLKFWVVSEKPIDPDHKAKIEVKEMSKSNALKVLHTNPEICHKIAKDLDKLLNVVKKSPSELLQSLPLLQDKTVDEFIEEYTNSHTILGKNEDSRAVYLSLTYLRNRKPESFEIINLLSIFPSGVFREHLGLICFKVTKHWHDALQLLEYEEGEEWLGKIRLSDSNIYYDSYKGYDSPMKRQKIFSSSNENLLSAGHSTKISNSRKNSFIGSLNEIVIVSDKVQNYLRHELLNQPSSIQNMFIICMEYLASLSRALMEAISQVPNIACSATMKSVINSNALSPVSTWKLYSNPDHDEDIFASVTNSKLLPQVLFENMKANFMEFINENNIKTIFHSYKHPKLGNLIFEISQCTICTLFLLRKKKEGFAVLNSAKKCLKAFAIDDSLNFKFRLTWSSMKLAYEKEIRIERVNKEIDKARHYFEGQNIKDSLSECYLLKAMATIQSKGSLRFGDIEELFKIARNNCEPENDWPNKLVLARINLAYCRWAHSFNVFHEEMIDFLTFSGKIFSELNLKALEEINYYILGEMYFCNEMFVNAEEVWMKVLDIAKLLKDRNKEIEIKEKLNLIFDRIKRRTNNVIVLLRAYPLVTVDIATGHYGADFIISSYFAEFKSSLLRNLQRKNKSFFIKSDIGTRENFKKYIKEGCRVLHFSSNMPQKDAIVLETNRFYADPIRVSEMDLLFGPSCERPGLDLIVLAMPFSAKLGLYLNTQLGISHILCFDYEEFPIYKHIVQLQMMFERAIELFCENFYISIIEGNTLYSAWEKSKNISDNFIRENKILFQHLSGISKNRPKLYLGKGPILIGNGNVALFRNSIHNILSSESLLNPGRILDMTHPTPPTNINKKKNHLIGRHKLMFEIIQELFDKKIVHIVGQKGVGKSRLAKQLMSFVNSRYIYNDGTFWISLKDQNSFAKFYECLEREGWVVSLDEKNEKSLKNKNILLILDDCDEVLKEANHQFSSLIEQLLKVYKLSLVITSRQVCVKSPYTKIEIKPLEPFESASMLLACLDRSLSRKEVIPYNVGNSISQDLLESNLLKECMNLPAKIRELASNLRIESFTDLEFKRIRSLEDQPTIPSTIRYHSEVNHNDSVSDEEEEWEEELAWSMIDKKSKRKRYPGVRRQKSNFNSIIKL